MGRGIPHLAANSEDNVLGCGAVFSHSWDLLA